MIIYVLELGNIYEGPDEEWYFLEEKNSIKKAFELVETQLLGEYEENLKIHVPKGSLVFNATGEYMGQTYVIVAQQQTED